MADEPINPTTPTTPDGGLPPAPTPYEGHVIAPDVDNSPPGPSEPAGPPAVSAEQFQALERRFEEQSQQNQQLNQTIQNLMMRPAYAPQGGQPGPSEPTAPAELNLEDLPDPVQNPKEYNAALSKRLNQHITQQSQSSQQALLGQVSTAQVMNNLWTRFTSEHSELAKKSALAQGAAATVFAELRAQGVDPVAVAQQNPDSIIGNVVRRMQAELGTAPTAPGTAPSAPTNPGAVPGAARTEGLSGGSAPGAPAGPAQPKPKSFNQQLKESQLRDGLI